MEGERDGGVDCRVEAMGVVLEIVVGIDLIMRTSERHLMITKASDHLLNLASMPRLGTQAASATYRAYLFLDIWKARVA